MATYNDRIVAFLITILISQLHQKDATGQPALPMHTNLQTPGLRLSFHGAGDAVSTRFMMNAPALFCLAFSTRSSEPTEENMTHQTVNPLLVQGYQSARLPRQ